MAERAKKMQCKRAYMSTCLYVLEYCMCLCKYLCTYVCVCECVCLCVSKCVYVCACKRVFLYCVSTLGVHRTAGM